MNFTRRQVLAAMGASTFAVRGHAADLPIAAGKFKPDDESLQQYQYPDWFRDAKFGMWAHWGPQAVPRQGDWYAKRMYQHDIAARGGNGPTRQDPANKYHMEHYGHPSKFGYKDIIPLWKAERWNPDQLMALYKKAGAKYFVSMATHHDNFALWNSKLHRWNAVQTGPRKDVVGLWQKAAKKQGMRFGVSEHLGASYTWFQSAHSADSTGPIVGVPYDGNDPQYADLYHGKAEPGDTGWLTNNPVWQREWFDRIKELVDGYHPDLLYSDSAMPFENVGRSLIAHYYNQDIAKNRGKFEAVYTCKQVSGGKWVRDIERGVAEGISAEPWQTDTSIGDWYYRTGQKYKTSTEIVQMLTDIVSKNGCLLINVVQTPEGDLEPDILKIVDGIAAWTSVNGEGIYGTRPWAVYGEGPSTKAQTKGQFGGLRDVPDKAYAPEDFRFTKSKDGKALYAFCLGTPGGEMRITSLGRNSKLSEKTVAAVQLLGGKTKLDAKQEDDALVIQVPANLPASPATGFKVVFAT
ncbi:MAG TPA: alpha-L-fucosidase [Candidatus Sulfopaludibacter sp.]|jgi:alpha-L-fucosidase|nr:alpha-L-fucosidase [Candidatus Sulfopaludibacter sp.]